MKRGIVALLVTFGFASSLHAAPGDPRLVQGVLEWPAKLTVEPFVVIRTDDGRWYYAEVKGVKRLDSGPLTSGTRVAVLGTEAARPHEITAIALGPGDAAALALALMPHVNAPAPAPTVVAHPPSAPKPVAAEPTSKTEPSPPSKAEPSPALKAEQTSTPKIIAKPERPATPSAALAPAAAPAVAATPAPTLAPTPAPAPAPAVGSVSAGAPTVPPSAKAAAPAVSDSPAPASARVGEAPAPVPPIAEKSSTEKAPEPAGDGPRWTELRGTVKVIAGNWIVVRVDNGQLVLVDLSTVRGGAASLKPGAAIALYGTPTEQKFQAMGIVQPENRPAAKPTTVPPRR
jgi:hypothetical protein